MKPIGTVVVDTATNAHMERIRPEPTPNAADALMDHMATKACANRRVHQLHCPNIYSQLASFNANTESTVALWVHS